MPRVLETPKWDWLGGAAFVLKVQHVHQRILKGEMLGCGRSEDSQSGGDWG